MDTKTFPWTLRGFSLCSFFFLVLQVAEWHEVAPLQEIFFQLRNGKKKETVRKLTRGYLRVNAASTSGFSLSTNSVCEAAKASSCSSVAPGGGRSGGSSVISNRSHSVSL